MPIDKRLLDMLCDPVSKVPVTPLGRARIDALNRAIEAGEVQKVTGAPVSESLVEGLITTDGKVIYRIDDGIPVLLPDEGIGTTQLHDFPK